MLPNGSQHRPGALCRDPPLYGAAPQRTCGVSRRLEGRDSPTKRTKPKVTKKANFAVQSGEGAVPSVSGRRPWGADGHSGYFPPRLHLPPKRSGWDRPSRLSPFRGARGRRVIQPVCSTRTLCWLALYKRLTLIFRHERTTLQSIRQCHC